MLVISSNMYEMKSHPIGRQAVTDTSTARRQKYSSVNKNINQISNEPLSAHTPENRIAFKGSSFYNGFSARLDNLIKRTKIFFFGSEAMPGMKLYKKIVEFIPETDSLVASIKHDADKHKLLHEKITNEKDGIKEEMRFHENLWISLKALPVFIWNKSRSFVDSDFKAKLQNKQAKIKARDNLLGLYMHVCKYEKDFDNGFSKSNIKTLQTILKKDDHADELAKFLDQKDLKELYNIKDGKKSGVLTEGDNMEKFKNAVMEETPLDNFKKDFINLSLDRTIRKKQGSFLPDYGHTEAQFVARVVSGVIPSWFIANDFYNLKMQNTDDKKEAKKEWNSKFGQETARIGIYAYTGFILNSCFERLTNISLAFALGLNVINSVTSNILSRRATNRPVLPVDVNAAVRLKEEHDRKKSHEKTKSNMSFGSKSTGIVESMKKPFKAVAGFFEKMDKDFASACPKNMTFQSFEEGIENVRKLDQGDARKMLKIVAEQMNIKIDANKHEESMELLKNAAEKNKNNVIIGANWVYRISKGLSGIFTVPLNVVKGTFRMVRNCGRWVLGKELIKAKSKDCFYPEQFVKNVTKWAKDAHKASLKDAGSDTNDPKILYGRHKNFFGTKILSYGADLLSTTMKLTGFVSVPFLAVDAYNVTLGETKDKKSSHSQAKQRALQDTTRQGVSFWFVKVMNTTAKELSNANIWGSGIVVAMQAFAYESFTRWVIGQPVLPTTHQRMTEVEAKRAKSNNWFLKAISGKVKTSQNIKQPAPPAAAQIENSSNTDSYFAGQQERAATLPKFNTDLKMVNNSNIFELYNQFSQSLN